MQHFLLNTDLLKRLFLRLYILLDGDAHFCGSHRFINGTPAGTKACRQWRSWPKILAGAGFTSTLNGANAKSTFARWP